MDTSFRLRAVSFIAAMALMGAGADGADVPGADFYVSPQGNDAWSGRLPAPNADRSDGAFVSLAAARDAVRRLKAEAGGQRPYTVLIRGGVYELPETLVFVSADSGTPGAPITYAAWPGETPVLSGGTRIHRWRREGDGRWVATVPGVAAGQWYGRQLFVDGQRRSRARTPNTGVLRSDGAPSFTPEDVALLEAQFGKRLGFAHLGRLGKCGFRYKPGDIQPWSNLDDVVLHMYHAWTSAIHWIGGLNASRRTVRFTGPCRFPSSHFEAQMPYIIENVPEALDEPGEWYLDRASGVLTYLAHPGEALDDADVVLSRLKTLIRIEGDAEQERFVGSLVFRGLSFQHADWGPLDRTQENDGYGAVHFLDAAVMARGATDCVFERCEIAHCGGYALYLIEGSARNRVQTCHLHDLGGGGILIGSRWSPYDTFKRPLPPDDAPDHVLARENVVDNCFIHGGGRIFRGVLGVFIAHSPYNKLTHNEICDMSYSGVCVGRRLDRKYSHAHHNDIGYNHIHHLGDGIMSDMGGVYTEGLSPGTRIHHNLIHDVRRYRYGAWGLYCDQASAGIRLDHNVCANCEDGGFMQNVGGPNVLENNILAFHLDRGMINSGRLRQGGIADILEVSRNIIWTNLGQVIGYYLDEGDEYRFERNLYWKPEALPLMFAGKTWTEWQESGQDPNSVVADPMFVDPAGGDFRLRPESPVPALGFEPIDTAGIGLYGDPAWVAGPRELTFLPFARVAPPLPAPVNQDFESLVAGDAVPYATVFGETATSSIRVTDAIAAGGKRCLQIVDAPGLAKQHWPWFAYQPKRDTGRISVDLDLRLGAGVHFVHEWRDGNMPYNVGPTLQFRAGELSANGRKLGPVPEETWCHVRIQCALGDQASGTYELEIRVPGEMPQVFSDLPCRAGDSFAALHWLGFIGMGDEQGTFYLDNIVLSEQTPP